MRPRDDGYDGARDAEVHKLIGGALCVDFVNTINGHERGPRGHEYLEDYRDLVLWCAHAGILTTEQSNGLLARSRQDPRRAALVFRRALALREALYRTFKRGVEGLAPSDSDVEVVDRERSRALSQSHLTATTDRVAVQWTRDPLAFDRVLAPLVLSAVELLTGDRRLALRQCAGDICDWLFLDTSRNQLRRWCSMEECGSRSKSRRQYERRLQGARVKDRGVSGAARA